MKITIKHDQHDIRKSPWLVTYYLDRKCVRKYFKTQDEAQAYAAEARMYLRSGYDTKEIALALRMVAGTAYSLTSVVQAGMGHLRSIANGHPQAASPAVLPHKTP
jgi:hypothetical protein